MNDKAESHRSSRHSDSAVAIQNARMASSSIASGAMLPLFATEAHSLGLKKMVRALEPFAEPTAQGRVQRSCDVVSSACRNFRTQHRREEVSDRGKAQRVVKEIEQRCKPRHLAVIDFKCSAVRAASSASQKRTPFSESLAMPVWNLPSAAALSSSCRNCRARKTVKRT